jgi:ABC-type bacteriocin/lantibiotic exporter with double-glycine peptidase domain
MIAFKSLAVAALLALGGYLVISQQMNLGQFVAAEILILLILGAVEKIIQLLETVYDVFTSLEKLGQIQDLPMVFGDANTSTPPENIFPVQLTKVDGDTAAIVFEIQQGEHRFVTGLRQRQLERLLRSLIDTSVSDFFRPRWNNTSPDPQTMAAACGHFGWYTPQSYVFDGSVADNVLLGRSALGTDQLAKALEAVGIRDRVRELALGNAAPANGEVFDTCELERLMLARAVVHAPALLIISFAGTALTVEEQEVLLRSISACYPETTIICALDKPFVSLGWHHTDLTETFK